MRALNLSHRREGVLFGRGTKYLLSLGASALTYELALDLLEEEDSFRGYLTGLLAESEYSAFRWETPPISRSTACRPFEFVLVNAPYLETDPEPSVFGRYFATTAENVTVLAVPNLGKTATMIVPKGLVGPDAYVHMAAFVRKAPPPQAHALWQCVGSTAKARLTTEPTWVSTAGAGVAWLHVRVESAPKYYSYRPYANDA